jgi:hypothetical protein
MVLALAIISNILWFAYSVWQNHCAKKEREILVQEVVDISLDCMSRLQARGPGDYKLLTDAKKQFEKKVAAPISTDEMKAKVHAQTLEDMKSVINKAVQAPTYRGQSISNGRGSVI